MFLGANEVLPHRSVGEILRQNEGLQVLHLGVEEAEVGVGAGVAAEAVLAAGGPQRVQPPPLLLLQHREARRRPRRRRGRRLGHGGLLLAAGPRRVARHIAVDIFYDFLDFVCAEARCLICFTESILCTPKPRQNSLKRKLLL